MKKSWTNSEIEILRVLYPDYTAREITEVLNRPISSIYNIARQMNLKKSEEFNRSVYSGRLTRATHNFAATQFKKGQRPFNKGKKLEEFMTQKGIESISKSWFAQGHLPHNTLSDGEIRVRKDKNNHVYKFIRVSLGVWKALHVYNWEKENGPVPEGFIVVFKTSDRMNCDVSNMEIITRREHMLRNSITRYPEELRSTMKILKKLTRTINDKE
jgi:hypothetical protein